MGSPTGGFTPDLSPDAVQTAIDGVAWEKYMTAGQPAALDVSDPTFFKQERFTGYAHIWDEYSGIPRTEEHQPQEVVKIQNFFVGNQKSQKVKFYKNDYPIAIEAFKTDKIGLRTKLAESVAQAVKTTQKYVSILDFYGDALTGTNFTVPDGQAAASNSHTTLRGATVDNLETGAATPDNVDILVRSLESQLGQGGDWGGNEVGGILCSRNLYKHMKEIMGSVLHADSGENNLNIFDTDYGAISLKQSPLLGSAFNSASNANTSYHIVAKQHHITRRVLVDMELEIVEPKYSETDSWVERVRHAEVTYPETYFGYAGCTGAA